MTNAVTPVRAVIAAPERWEVLCEGAKAGYHPADVWEQGPGEALTIAMVRAAKAFAATTPVGDRKLIVLAGADTWRLEVANALLKLLEEPPTYVDVLVLAGSQRLLPTLASRLPMTPDAEGSASSVWDGLFLAYQPLTPATADTVNELFYWQALAHPGHDAKKIVHYLLP